MLTEKHQLHSIISGFIDERIKSSEEAIYQLQLSANEETKSSAGDKYETGRAMAHLEIQKYREQLSQSIKLKQAFTRITLTPTNQTVMIGSLVYTNRGNFYIAISCGKF